MDTIKTYTEDISNIKKELYKLNSEIAAECHNLLMSELGKKGYDYLNKRRISDASINRFNIGYIPNSENIYKIMVEKGYSQKLLLETGIFNIYDETVLGKFHNKIVFPLYDINNNIIGFQFRTVDDSVQQFKYININENLVFKKREYLYGMNYVQNSKRDYLCICEGIIDVIRLYQAGYDNAIALLGAALFDYQILLLKRINKKICLCLDTDAAGCEATKTNINLFEQHNIKNYAIDIKPYKDVDEWVENADANTIQNVLEET